MIKGMSLVIFLPYVEQSIVVNNVTMPHRKAISGEATGTFETASASSYSPAALSCATVSITSVVTEPFTISPTAFPASDRPIIATVGPITTAGINLSIHLTPTFFTMIAITT